MSETCSMCFSTNVRLFVCFVDGTWRRQKCVCCQNYSFGKDFFKRHNLRSHHFIIPIIDNLEITNVGTTFIHGLAIKQVVTPVYKSCIPVAVDVNNKGN